MSPFPQDIRDRPSEVQQNFRFGISFYLIAMLFILFDIEVIFLYPVAIQYGYGAIWFRLEGERYRVFDDHRKKEVEKVKSGPVVIDDKIRGKVERMEDEDFVIFRSDGNPVFRYRSIKVLPTKKKP